MVKLCSVMPTLMIPFWGTLVIDDAIDIELDDH